jgi:predicted dehydrogenase
MRSSALELDLEISPTFPDLPPSRISVIGTIGQLRQAVATGTAPECSGTDNLRTMALIEAAYQSAATGRVARPAAFLSEASGE